MKSKADIGDLRNIMAHNTMATYGSKNIADALISCFTA